MAYFLKKSKLKKEFIFKFMRVFMTRNVDIQRINLTKLWGILTILSGAGSKIRLHFINRKSMS